MVEQNRVGGSVRVNTDVSLLSILVRNERLDDEVAQLAIGVSDLLVFSHSLADPLLHLLEVLVDSNQTQLSTTLYKLIWLHDQRLMSKQKLESAEFVSSLSSKHHAIPVFMSLAVDFIAQQ